MIIFSKHYCIAEEEIESIKSEDVIDKEFPYLLSVFLKSGRVCSVKYKFSEDRDNARNEAVRKIERAKLGYSEQTLIKLSLLNSAIERIERRQLRIWRQLKALLNISGEEE